MPLRPSLSVLRCKALRFRAVRVYEGLKYISRFAFQYCTGLKTIVYEGEEYDIEQMRHRPFVVAEIQENRVQPPRCPAGGFFVSKYGGGYGTIKGKDRIVSG